MASRTALLPLNAKERLDTPPEVSAPGRFVLIHLTASIKSTAYFACSSMPVPIESMFTSKMMSSGATPASSVRSLYALSQISILRSYVVAWPCSSKAITTIAAPNSLIALAFSTNASAPSLRLIEFTMHFPCAFLSPAMMVSQCDESIISAAFATAGSLDIYLTKRSISRVLSSMASSILMSMMVAPSSICLAAIRRASSYSPEAIRRANLREPATLVLSPTFVKLFLRTSTSTASSPLTFRVLVWSLAIKSAVFLAKPSFSEHSAIKRPVFLAKGRAGMPLTAWAMALMCAGDVPQQPPRIFTRPLLAITFTASPICSGVWS